MRTGLTQAPLPDDVWAVDYKGWFRLGNGERCEPLTVSNLFSRYVLCCFGLPNVSYEHAFPVFQELFKEKGQPLQIRVDNGPPFGSRGAAGLSRLAVWWVSLGIGVEFIDPGHPEQNGSHERMHRTLKAEVLSPVAITTKRSRSEWIAGAGNSTTNVRMKPWGWSHPQAFIKKQRGAI
jgi:transposase InsO family protein